MTHESRQAECRIVSVEERRTAVIPAKVPLRDIREAQRSLRSRIAAALPEAEAGGVGASLTLWRPPVDGILDMEPGHLVSDDFAATGDLVLSCLPAGTAAHLRLMGGYEGIPGAWQVLFEWCAGQKLALAGINWEIYAIRSDEPATQETLLYALIKG